MVTESNNFKSLRTLRFLLLLEIVIDYQAFRRFTLQNKEMKSKTDDNWQAKYRNDSRQWLTSECDNKKKWKMPSTTSKSAFVNPKTGDFHSVGRRKELYHDFFTNEVKNELVEKLIPTNPISPYKTEYMGSFSRNYGSINVQSSNYEKMSELFPLYTNEPCLSFWQQNRSSIPGITAHSDSKNIFHKNASFTKPIAEVLDDPSVNYPHQCQM